LVPEIDDLTPDYSLIPGWKACILFASRGCIRKCPFCSVAQLEPKFEPGKSIRHLLYPGHNKIILWDNNILASPYWRDIFDELEESGLMVDFNKGLDARLLTDETALRLRRLRVLIISLAYDTMEIKKSLLSAINLLKEVSISGRNIVVYCLYGYMNKPEDFLERVRDLINWGVVAYPMRYQPLEPCLKDSYVSANWTAEQLEMIARARRVIGYGGAFPHYEGLRKKFAGARTFEDAFQLRPLRGDRDLATTQN
jgi:hypothetical protein